MDAPKRWTFGVEPLPAAREIATRLRNVASLVLSLEASHPAVARLAAGGDLLCEAEVRAVAGDLSALPAVSPRRGA